MFPGTGRGRIGIIGLHFVPMIKVGQFFYYLPAGIRPAGIFKMGPPFEVWFLKGGKLGTDK